jgi:hypothetical protein
MNQTRRDASLSFPTNASIFITLDRRVHANEQITKLETKQRLKCSEASGLQAPTILIIVVHNRQSWPKQNKRRNPRT